jgi:two-component sensor histidine kinase
MQFDGMFVEPDISCRATQSASLGDGWRFLGWGQYGAVVCVICYMSDIYKIRRWGTGAFFVVALVIVGAFLYVSNRIVRDVAARERDRMEIWADATRQLAQGSGQDVDFLLRIIEDNTSIPVLLTSDSGEILLHRNFNLPEAVDSGRPLYISDVNKAYLEGRLQALRSGENVIDIEIEPGVVQHLYYEDSSLLKLLSYYPYVQVVVMIIFVATIYFSVTATRKAEQNKVWVGLSKETAHQLGTPISSLMAWLELMRGQGVDAEMVDEMEKDVDRLSMIASRFGKIGSQPSLETADLNGVVERVVEYMSSRISSRISLRLRESGGALPVAVCAPLFEWVMENLIKNSVDAMDGDGWIEISVRGEGDKAIVDVADSGRGIPRKQFKTVFNAGYTTKSRGWGLGLTLAKRIVEQYHGGGISVVSSSAEDGTVFRIVLPVVKLV